jgi:hypothetical protein
MGKQVKSTNTTMPSPSMAGREKFGSTFDIDSASGPGPGNYSPKNLSKSQSAQMAGRWAPSFNFNKSPAPNQYGDVHGSSHGDQQLSTKISEARCKIGLSKRPELLQTGKDSPAPGRQ